MKHEKLNVWLAEHLFGFEWWQSSATGNRGLFPPDRVPDHFKKRADGSENLCFDHPSHVPDYAGNIADAFRVVEKMREKYDLYLSLTTSNHCAYFYELVEREPITGRVIVRSFEPVFADTAAEAISKTAKAAIEELEKSDA